MKILVVSFVLVWSLGEAASPESPRKVSSGVAGKSADCSQPQGFTGIGLRQVHNTGLVSYKNDLVTLGPGFRKETGEFTVHCPGLYLVSFAAYPQSGSPNGLTLKHRGRQGNTWRDVVSVGGPGGFNQVLVRLEAGEQMGVFMGSPRVQEGSQSTVSFTAYLLSKK